MQPATATPKTTSDAGTTPPLNPDETVLARMAIDLDGQGRFAKHQLALTQKALWTFEGADWRRIDLSPGMRLRHTDLAGVASLDLLGANGLQARWRCCSGRLR